MVQKPPPWNCRRRIRRQREIRLGRRLGVVLGPVRGRVAEAATEADLALAPDPIGEQFQGGGFCTMEFTGDVRRIK